MCLARGGTYLVDRPCLPLVFRKFGSGHCEHFAYECNNVGTLALIARIQVLFKFRIGMDVSSKLVRMKHHRYSDGLSKTRRRDNIYDGLDDSRRKGEPLGKYQRKEVVVVLGVQVALENLQIQC